MSPHFHPRGEREGADTEAVPAMVQLNLAQGGAVADFDLLEAAEGFASVSHAAHEVARPALGRTWSVCRPRNHSQRQPTPLTSRLGGTPATRALRPAPRGGPCVAPPVRLGRPPWFARCSTRASSLTEVGHRCHPSGPSPAGHVRAPSPPGARHERPACASSRTLEHSADGGGNEAGPRRSRPPPHTHPSRHEAPDLAAKPPGTGPAEPQGRSRAESRSPRHPPASLDDSRQAFGTPHWTHDVTYGEDQARVRTSHAARNLATVRRGAPNRIDSDARLTRLKEQGVSEPGTVSRRARPGDMEAVLRIVQASPSGSMTLRLLMPPRPRRCASSGSEGVTGRGG
jgi:hypothetical protein